MQSGHRAFAPPGHPHPAYCAPDDPRVPFIAFADPVDAFPVE